MTTYTNPNDPTQSANTFMTSPSGLNSIGTTQVTFSDGSLWGVSSGGYLVMLDGPSTGSASSSKSQTPNFQNFNIKCTGLKPNTVHKFYYEGIDRSINCRPLAPKPSSGVTTVGSELKTDSKGMIVFEFFFTPEIEKQVDAANKVKYELAGDKKFELRATDSFASKIVPFT